LAQTTEPLLERCLSPPDEAGGFQRKNHPPPLGQRERSTSAPNVCYNVVGQHPTEISDEILHRVKGNSGFQGMLKSIRLE